MAAMWVQVWAMICCGVVPAVQALCMTRIVKEMLGTEFP